MIAACKLFGNSSQAYYQHRIDRVARERQESRVMDATREIRSLDPGIGGQKILDMLHALFPNEWVPGRDKFYAMLDASGLALPRVKPRHTTKSNHRYRTYHNEIRGFIPTAANQLWVADITYIDLDVGCSYLHLLTDAYSHKIIGWKLAESLESEHTIDALVMAINDSGLSDFSGLIHHSDRGTQYCCTAYTNILKELGITISMTESYKPTDNAIAERINGILKTEVIYREKRYKTIHEARRRIAEYIEFYNNRRPHMSIGNQTPAVAHTQTGIQTKKWKQKVYKKRTASNQLIETIN